MAIYANVSILSKVYNYILFSMLFSYLYSMCGGFFYHLSQNIRQNMLSDISSSCSPAPRTLRRKKRRRPGWTRRSQMYGVCLILTFRAQSIILGAALWPSATWKDYWQARLLTDPHEARKSLF